MRVATYLILTLLGFAWICYYQNISKTANENTDKRKNVFKIVLLILIVLAIITVDKSKIFDVRVKESKYSASYTVAGKQIKSYDNGNKYLVYVKSINGSNSTLEINSDYSNNVVKVNKLFSRLKVGNKYDFELSGEKTLSNNPKILSAKKQ